MLKLWLLVFNSDGLKFGERLPVDATDDENVQDLKIRVTIMLGGRLSHTQLTIWRCKDQKTLFDGDTKSLFRQIQDIFSPDVEEARLEGLSPSQKSVDLHISEEETLPVETPPSMSHIFRVYGPRLHSHTC